MSEVQNSLNTTENLIVNRPAAKDWDEMTEAEQAAERSKAQKMIAEADRPDPSFDREVDRALGQMKKVFGDQKRHPIILYQITGAMKAQGMQELAPAIVGVNGYNFVIPRAVPIELPEDVVHILYNAGEVSPQTMLALGLATIDRIQADLRAANEVAQEIANKIAPMEL